MKELSIFIILSVLASQTLSDESPITFNNDKLGVNFGGYHAAVGLGGLFGSSGNARGGLFAEAGTPFGQAARAGLGGDVDGKSSAAGGLYAGATAGANVKASAALGGTVASENSAGVGYAAAQAGDDVATYKKKDVTITKVSSVPVEPKVGHKKVYSNFNIEAANDIKTDLNVNSENFSPATIVKEIYTEPVYIKEKHVVRNRKPSRHQLRKSGYIGGYLGGNVGYMAEPQPPVYIPEPQPPVTVLKYVEPAIQKRVEIVEESDEISKPVLTNVGQVGYTKQITFHRNPNFFTDIFNIPISTLKAVSDFIGNTVKGTSVSVQKSASIQTDAELTPKHAHSSSSPSSFATSEGQLSIKTPEASKVVDDIFAIPINTLSAVNTFLENNIPARKRIQVSQDGAGEPTKVVLGPHARRRMNKTPVLALEENSDNTNNQYKNSQ